MLRVLENFNFGPSFVRWVEVICKNIASCVMNNGECTPYFPVERGVRQGDPLSPYLFIVVLEVLQAHIRSNEGIRGIQIGDSEAKLVVFAVDITAFLDGKKSYDNLIAALKCYEKKSGLGVNENKTEAMWLGSSCGNKIIIEIEKMDEPIKIIGIYFTYD